MSPVRDECGLYKMPCGHCDIGTYDAVPLTNGLNTFGSCSSRREALRAAPRCKNEPDHICFGARDWIVSASFPLSAIDRRRIEALST